MTSKYVFAIYADRASLTRAAPLDHEIKRSFGRLPVDIRFIDRHDLANDALYRDVHALFVPGIEGEHSYYPEHISPHGDKIRAFVRKGGVYWGECAGAFLGAQYQSYDAPWLDAPKGDGQVLLGLSPIKAEGPVLEYAVADDDAAHFNGLRLIPLSSDFFEDGRDVHVVYSKGPRFIGSGFNALAFYDSARTKPAIIENEYGRGLVMLLGPMPKYPVRPQTGYIQNLDSLLSAMASYEGDRRRFFDILMLKIKRHVDKQCLFGLKGYP